MAAGSKDLSTEKRQSEQDIVMLLERDSTGRNLGELRQEQKTGQLLDTIFR
jgi:hypothetical protein